MGECKTVVPKWNETIKLQVAIVHLRSNVLCVKIYFLLQLFYVNRNLRENLQNKNAKKKVFKSICIHWIKRFYPFWFRIEHNFYYFHSIILLFHISIFHFIFVCFCHSHNLWGWIFCIHLDYWNFNLLCDLDIVRFICQSKNSNVTSSLRKRIPSFGLSVTKWFSLNNGMEDEENDKYMGTKKFFFRFVETTGMFNIWYGGIRLLDWKLLFYFKYGSWDAATARCNQLCLPIGWHCYFPPLPFIVF